MSGRPRLILASASPRRRQLLAELSVPFEVRVAEVDERPLPGEAGGELARRLAAAKALAVARALRGDEAGRPVLGADTVVALGSELLGKPGGPEEAREMLRRLSGRAHAVHTGIALVRGRLGSIRTRLVTTTVAFRPLAEEEIERYVATGEPLDKAGAYAIQGGGGRFAERIEGSRSNVVGLPLDETRELLAEEGLL